MSRIPPLRTIVPVRAARMAEPPFVPMPEAIDQWLETAFDPSVDGDDLAAPLCGSRLFNRGDDE